MASIAQLQNDIRRYRVLKDKILMVVTELDAAEDAENRITVALRANYVINNRDTIVTTRAIGLEKAIGATANTLRKVLRQIDSAVAYANQEIRRMEEQERQRRLEEERRRAEEERKREEERLRREAGSVI